MRATLRTRLVHDGRKNLRKVLVSFDAIRISWASGFILVALLGAVACGVADGRDWERYRDPQAGYEVEYPKNWRVERQVLAGGDSLSIFVPSDAQQGGSSIRIETRSGGMQDLDRREMPNEHCQRITIKELPGLRCSLTVESTITTTLVGQGRLYVIQGHGPRSMDIYQRFLESFSLIPLG